MRDKTGLIIIFCRYFCSTARYYIIVS